MAETTEIPPGSPSPAVRLDEDRACRSCGRSLRYRPIERDPRTLALFVTCADCGQAEPLVHISASAQIALHRYAGLVLGIWLTLVVAGFLGLAFIQAGISAYALEKLTTHGGPGGSLIIHARYSRYSDELVLLTGYLAGISVCTGLAAGILAALLFPHWRTWAYLVLVMLLPACAACAIAIFWRHEAPHLFTWGLRFIIVYACVQQSGGLVGVLAGRPLARTIARIILPPRWRPFVGYLWTVDGKSVPGGHG